MIPDMPKRLPYKGVSLYYREPKGTRAGAWRMEFNRRGRKGRKTLTLKATSEALAYAEAVDYGRRFEAGLFDPWQDRAEVITLGEGIRRYLASNPRWSTATRRERKIVLENFRDELGKSMDPRDVTAVQVERFCRASHLKPSTQKGYLSKLKAFFNWLVREKYLRDNPCTDVREIRAPRKLPVYLSRSEAAHLIKQAETDTTLGTAKEWLPDMIRLALSTGLRLGELCALRWCDIDLDRSQLYARSYDNHRTKSGHDRAVPVFPVAREVIERRGAARRNEDETETVFVGGKRKTRLNPNHVSHQFREQVKRAKLPPKFTFHTLRHTYATWLVSEGVTLRHLQSWLGHASIVTTMIYAHLVEERAHAVGGRTFASLDSPAGGGNVVEIPEQ